MARLELFIIGFVSFCLAVFLGWIDRETESLVHLFTADGGNIVMLAILTICFSVMGAGVLLLCKKSRGFNRGCVGWSLKRLARTARLNLLLACSERSSRYRCATSA